MTRKLRFLLAGLTAGALSLATIGPALAHVCFVAPKPEGAGSAGDATVNVVTGEFTLDPSALNPAGNIKGGFLSVNAVLPDGTVVAEADVFAHTTLPESARNAGPGDDMCDGVGVDDAEACFGG